MKFYELLRIKEALGLPASASASQIEERIFELRDKAGELHPLEGNELPPEERPELPAENKSTLVTELNKMEFEPLLPVEKKLIGWSIGLGVLALGLLVWISYTFLSSGH